MKTLSKAFNLFFLALVLYFAFFWYNQIMREKTLRKIIENLRAETRIAEVLVTDSHEDPASGAAMTTIKFLEYDASGRPLPPRYFTFNGNVIQFQTLVIRFDDIYIEKADRLRGRSAYLFMKAFALSGEKTQEFDISETYSVPEGYKVAGAPVRFQREIWKRFWTYVLDPAERSKLGIKNAQIEAPGSLFVPGTIYTLKIEHDGGLRIDANPIPEILKGEKIDR